MAVKWRNVETDSDLDFTSESGSISEDLASSMSGNSAYTPVKSSKKGKKPLFTPIPTNGLNPIKTNNSSVSDENALLANIAAKAYEHPVVREALKQAALRANNEPITPENRQMTSDEVLDFYRAKYSKTDTTAPQDSSSLENKRKANELAKRLGTSKRNGVTPKVGATTPTTPAASTASTTSTVQGNTGAVPATKANANGTLPTKKEEAPKKDTLTEKPTAPQNPTQPVRGVKNWTKEEKEKFAAEMAKYGGWIENYDPFNEYGTDIAAIPGQADKSLTNNPLIDRDLEHKALTPIGKFEGSTAAGLARAGQTMAITTALGAIGSGLGAAFGALKNAKGIGLTKGKLPKVTVGKGAGKFGIKFEGGKVPRPYIKQAPPPGAVTEATVPGRITGNGSRQIPPPPGTRTPIGKTVKINGKDVSSVADENTLFRELNNTGLRRRIDPKTGNLESERSFIERNGYNLIERQRWDEATKSWVKDPNYGKYEYTGRYPDVSGRGVPASSSANRLGESIEHTQTPIPKKVTSNGKQQLTDFFDKEVVQNGKKVKVKHFRITDGKGNQKVLQAGSEIPPGWKPITKSYPSDVKNPGQIGTSETGIDWGNPALKSAVKERITGGAKQGVEGLVNAGVTLVTPLSLTAGHYLSKSTTPTSRSYEEGQAEAKRIQTNREAARKEEEARNASLQATFKAKEEEWNKTAKRLNINISDLSEKDRARFRREIHKLPQNLSPEERDKQMVAAYTKYRYNQRSRW